MMATTWQPAQEDWLIDAVLAMLLSPGDQILLAAKAEAITPSETRVDFRLDLPERSAGYDSLLTRIDRRDGINRLGTANLPLAEGVTYRSIDDRLVSHAGMGSDDTGSTRVVFNCGLSVKGVVPPETILSALPGSHATAVLDHRGLQVPELLILSASYNGRPAQSGQPAEWTGFFVALPSTFVPIARA